MYAEIEAWHLLRKEDIQQAIQFRGALLECMLPRLALVHQAAMSTCLSEVYRGMTFRSKSSLCEFVGCSNTQCTIGSQLHSYTTNVHVALRISGHLVSN